jgi:hypothetical protein
VDLWQSWDSISGNWVYKISETKFSFNNFLTLFALVNTFFEFVRIFIEEEETKSGDKFLLSSCNDLDFEFTFFVLIWDYLNRFPAVLITLVNRA